MTSYDKERQKDVRERLDGIIDKLHPDGKFLEAPCPQCGGEDRFISGPKTNWEIFKCKVCGHVANYGSGGAIVDARPAVMDWKPDTVDNQRIAAIREIYALFTIYAQQNLEQSRTAIEYAAARGFAPSQLGFDVSVDDLRTIKRLGFGYINNQLYQDWYNSLDQYQQDAVDWAGMPGRNAYYSGHGRMLVCGHRGKLVIPYHDENGNVIDIRTRSISDKDTVGAKKVRYTSPRGNMTERGAIVPYGVPFISGNRLVLTEGEFKAAAASVLADVPTIGLRGVNDWHDNYLHYMRGRLMILAFDNDTAKPGRMTAGQIATVEVGRKLVAHDIDVMVLDPALLGDQKGLDDYINVYGAVKFAQLVNPYNLITLSMFERRLTDAGHDLSQIKAPRTDPGTRRYWMPQNAVNAHAHPHKHATSLDAVRVEIEKRVADHVARYKRGNDQLLITAPPGTGKTIMAIRTVTDIAEREGKTVAVILPNHDTIDEKIADGTLKGFTHIYGHRWDNDPQKGIQNCEQAEDANYLTRKGYSPSTILCPLCPFLTKCDDSGYRSQFKDRKHRAYVQAHAFTNYPSLEDVVIADEMTHKVFIDTMKIDVRDITLTLAKGQLIPQAQRELLAAITNLFQMPGLDDIGGAALYELLEAQFPTMRDIDTWSDGSPLQGALWDAANEYTKAVIHNKTVITPAPIIVPDLPQHFAALLIEIMSDDVHRLNRGDRVSGRARLVNTSGGHRYLELTYNRGLPPGEWYAKRPTIILNATADADIMQEIAGPLKVYAPHVAIADGNTIVQDVTYNNAATSYSGDTDSAKLQRAKWAERIKAQIDAHPGGEADTVIIAAMKNVDYLENAFPNAKVAYYMNLEGRNDLQAGLTILAGAVPINMDAVKREAAALWPGIDTTMTRKTIAFDYANATGELLATEQIDAVDKRLSMLIAQHRDAPAVQAAHRSRVISRTGRKVVVMFSRPIPDLPPMQIITDRSTISNAGTQKSNSLNKLIDAAKQLLGKDGAFTLPTITEAADVSKHTAIKYWNDVTKNLSLKWFELPVLQPLSRGGYKSVDMRCAVDSAKFNDVHAHNNNNLITCLHVVKPLLHAKWEIDQTRIDAMIADAYARTQKQQDRAEPVPELATLPTEEARPEITATIEELEIIEMELEPVARGAVLKMSAAANLISRIRAANLHHDLDVTAACAIDTHAYGQHDWTITNAGAVLMRIREIVSESEAHTMIDDPEFEDEPYWFFDDLQDESFFGEVPDTSPYEEVCGISFDDVKFFQAMKAARL